MKTFIQLKTLSVFILTLAPAITLASSSNFYEIEMTVFTNESSRYANEQTWPNNVNVEYPSSLLSLSTKPAELIYPELINSSNPSINPNLIPIITSTNSKHNDYVSKLQRSSQHRVLFHETWVQNIGYEKYARPLIIQGGRIESNVFELGGTVSLFFAKTKNAQISPMHIQTHLWLVSFGENNSAKPWPIPASFAITDNGITPMAIDTHVKIQRIAVLNTREIINRYNLHYIDHPLLSVLIEVRAYNSNSNSNL